MRESQDKLTLKGNERFKVVLTDEGIKFYIEKDCLDEVTVLRRINDEPWKEIARDVRTTFVDTDKIATPACIEYKLLYKISENDNQVVRVHLP